MQVSVQRVPSLRPCGVPSRARLHEVLLQGGASAPARGSRVGQSAILGTTAAAATERKEGRRPGEALEYRGSIQGSAQSCKHEHNRRVLSSQQHVLRDAKTPGPTKRTLRSFWRITTFYCRPQKSEITQKFCFLILCGRGKTKGASMLSFQSSI